MRIRSASWSLRPCPEAAPKLFAAGGRMTEDEACLLGFPGLSITPACRSHFLNQKQLIPASRAATIAGFPAMTASMTSARNDAGNISNSLLRSRTHPLRRPEVKRSKPATRVLSRRARSRPACGAEGSTGARARARAPEHVGPGHGLRSTSAVDRAAAPSDDAAQAAPMYASARRTSRSRPPSISWSGEESPSSSSTPNQDSSRASSCGAVSPSIGTT